MKKNQTRRALLMSALSLLLCMSMLVGTTFAWFTDSVTSANNIIKSGNLDIELEYAVFNEDGTFEKWVDVAGKSDILTNTLWEPGVTEVAYLRVANAGSLALKYQMGINIVSETLGKTKDNADIKLSDHILFGVVEGVNGETGAYANREAAVAALTDAKKLNAGYTKAASMTAGQELYLALVVYMPTSVGNEANHNGTNVPKIDLGVNVFATQVEAEFDSFGKDYDKDAEYDSNAVVNGNATESTKLSTENTQVEIPAGAEGGTYVLDTSEITTTEKDGVVTATMDITLLRNGAKAEATDPTKPFVVTVNIGAGLNLTKVLHNNEELTGYTYDIATGDLTFETTHFSPFAFVYDTVGATVTTVEELNAALANGGLITLGADITSSAKFVVTKSTVINGNGKTITYTGADRAIDIPNKADAKVNVAIENLTVDCTASYCQRGVNYNDDGALVLNNVTIKGTNVTYALNLPGSSDNCEVTITDSSLTGNIALNVWGEKATINATNTTFTAVDNNTVEGYAAVKLNNDGTTSAEGTVVTIKGGKIDVTGSACTDTEAVSNATNTGVIDTSATEVNGETRKMVAIISYGENFYSFVNLQDAINKAQNGETVVLISDIESADGVLITDKNITIDLNGKTFTVTEGASTNNRNFKVNGTSEVTIKNGTMIAAGELTSGAYGTVRTEGAAKVTLENLKLYSYRGYGLNVKACSGTTIVINDCEIYAQYSGGVEAVGGTIELNNTKIEQKGIYSSAAWCSVAIGVNGGGKVIVNSGDYTASVISTDANAAQGTWVAYVMSSGGTLEINGGTFNGVVAETATAANACGVICADRAAVVNINGGTFNSNGAILDMRNNVGSLPNPVATLAGGTFSADPRVSGLYSSNLIKVAEGYEVVETNGTWTVAAN